MRKRTPIGEILGISPDDVERALAHQRESGGYFGDALVALGLSTPAEVKWGLANQYDLPFVNLRSDGIDHGTAARVPAEWAREHLVLPVLRYGDTVTVVLSDPRDLERLAEVQAFTGAVHIDPALSTPATIRALIDAVHGEPDHSPVPLLDFLAEALEAGAEEVGVSIRGGRAAVWARRSAVSRRPLEGDPLPELRRAVTPFPDAGGGERGVRRWPARISAGGAAWAAECHVVGDAGRLEWAARITGSEAASSPAVRVDPEARAAVAAALQGDGVLVAVRAAAGAEGVLERVLPGLPALLLEGEARAMHLSDRAAGGVGGEIVVPVGDSLRAAVESVRPFALDALTVDVGEIYPLDAQATRHAAPLVVFHLRSGHPVEAADLHLTLRPEGDALVWTRNETADAAD